MGLLFTIKMLCKRHGITVAELERKAGLSHSTIARWDRNAPSIDKVAAVADYFGMSIDELIGRETTSQISLEDRRILALFDELNQEGRLAAMKQLEFIAAQPEYIKSGQSGEMEA